MKLAGESGAREQEGKRLVQECLHKLRNKVIKYLESY